MAALQIQLLGGFKLTWNDITVTSIHQPRLQSLLAYLLLHRYTPQARNHMAFTFWPDAAESQAHNNLRQMLYQLRRRLPNADSYLYLDVNVVQWLPDSPFQLDVDEFEKTVTRTVALEHGDSRAACEAKLYRRKGETHLLHSGTAPAEAGNQEKHNFACLSPWAFLIVVNENPFVVDRLTAGISNCRWQYCRVSLVKCARDIPGTTLLMMPNSQITHR